MQSAKNLAAGRGMVAPEPAPLWALAPAWADPPADVSVRERRRRGPRIRHRLGRLLLQQLRDGVTGLETGAGKGNDGGLAGGEASGGMKLERAGRGRRCGRLDI